jgi:hypothetical protein
MTPKFADRMALTYYFLFWGAILWMVAFYFTHVYHYQVSGTTVLLAALGFSYFTVYLSKWGE